MCEFHLPLYDESTNKFLEPYLPNHPLALVHLAGLDEIREQKELTIDIKTKNGKILKNLYGLMFKFEKLAFGDSVVGVMSF